MKQINCGEHVHGLYQHVCMAGVWYLSVEFFGDMVVWEVNFQHVNLSVSEESVCNINWTSQTYGWCMDITEHNGWYMDITVFDWCRSGFEYSKIQIKGKNGKREAFLSLHSTFPSRTIPNATSGTDATEDTSTLERNRSTRGMRQRNQAKNQGN